VSRPRELIFPITSVRRATPSTRYVRLALNGARLRFQAGQAAMIGLAESDQRVPYSIASAPDEVREQDAVEFLIKIEPSGRWGHKFDRLARGQRVAVDGPMGSFVLGPDARQRPLLFIAGGTGIAPVRSMIHDALRHRHGSINLLYSARTRDGFAYASELRALARRSLIGMRLHVTREAPKGWRGERGRIAPSHIAPLVQDRSTRCFVCGPAAMVADLPLMLRHAGVPGRNITLEKWDS
jgi:Na+-transporting NADH:ubiquinone oxidoreductase subunit F